MASRALKPGAAQRCIDALALLHRTPSEEERREAARALGLEHMLPEAQEELALVVERKKGLPR